jgi:RNA polymerase sigma factor (sigma-70 family)
LVSGTGEINPDDDRIHTAAALDAKRGNRVARNALYFAFLPKIERFTRREAWKMATASRSHLLDADDIAQEGFLAFVRLIDDWPGDQPFSRYFLGRFRWDLRNALRTFVRPETHGELRLDIGALDRLGRPSRELDEDDIDLARLAEEFSELDRAIFLALVRDGFSQAATARRLRIGQRTVARAWSRIRDRLIRRVLGDASEH